MESLKSLFGDFAGSLPPPPPALLDSSMGLAGAAAAALLGAAVAFYLLKPKKAAPKMKATKSTPGRAAKSPGRTPAKLPKKTYLADKNSDGKTTRSEAKAANLRISRRDLNDDGRTTRSEAKAAKNAGLD